MTTVIDPAGTPTPVYNKSGKVIIAMNGSGSGSTSVPPVGNTSAAIPHYAERTIVVGTTNNPSYGFLLPAADIGDEVVVLLDPASTFGSVVFPQIGESIAGFPTSTGTNNAAGSGAAQPQQGATFIKVSSTSWQTL